MCKCPNKVNKHKLLYKIIPKTQINKRMSILINKKFSLSIKMIRNQRRQNRMRKHNESKELDKRNKKLNKPKKTINSNK